MSFDHLPKNFLAFKSYLVLGFSNFNKKAHLHYPYSKQTSVDTHTPTKIKTLLTRVSQVTLDIKVWTRV